MDPTRSDAVDIIKHHILEFFLSNQPKETLTNREVSHHTAQTTMPVTKIATITSLLPFKRRKPGMNLGSVADEVENSIPFTSVIAQTPARESVNYYSCNDIHVGKLLKSGQFFEWHKLKRMPDQEDEDQSDKENTDLSKKRHTQYTVKQLCPKNFLLSRKTLVQQAALRLVLEAKYLSCLDHPNILQAKALPSGEESVMQQGTFFVVTPRVVETLEARLTRWRQFQGERKREVESFAGATFCRKLGYAKDLAAALAYLHERNLVLLNLSPQTVGFLEDGILQITDLSCCQEVEEDDESTLTVDSEDDEMARSAMALTDRTRASPADVSTNYLMQMASNGGVPRHVAPEAILHDQYTCKADVYSFSLILFELLTLSQPYFTYKAGQHLMKACVEGQRPNLSVYKLPKVLSKLVCRTWSQTVYRRPAMSKVLAAIPVPQRQKVTVANPQA